MKRAPSLLVSPAVVEGRPDPERCETRAEEEGAGFDLRDLAKEMDVSGGFSQPVEVSCDPFAILDTAHDQVRRSADPLAVLLEAKPKRRPSGGIDGHAQTHASVRPDGATTASPASGESPATARREDVDVVTGHQNGTGFDGMAGPVVPDVFQDLQEEFLRVVRDPGQIAARLDWDFAAGRLAEAAPTFEDLSREAQPFTSIRDVLQRQTSIDEVINGMDESGPAGPLEEVEPEDVLRMFAPEVPNDRRAPLPGLTRREHHQLSMDSFMEISSPRGQEEPP
ncbi:MAG: TagK domain-containing protein [Comamonadaceae bacterium]|nr:MAG: TagK domain-containing protein [Comamonadaceae bacterium]